MNKNILNGFVRSLTGAGYLDVKFLIEIIEAQNLDIEDIVESVEMNFWKEYRCDFNYIMYETLATIASNFINENQELFEDCKNDEYEIFTNYMDSHIRFVDEDIQRKFEEYF